MSTPTSFAQSLHIAGHQQQRSRIGNPYAYLSDVGVDSILEHLYRGANLVDVAEALDTSITLLRNWLEQEGHWHRVEEATSLSAEGYLSLGRRMLHEAKDKFQLDRAKAMTEHARWMAQRLNKPMYGTQETLLAPTTVSYTFNVGGDAQIAAPAQLAPRVGVQDAEEVLSAQALPVEFELVDIQTLYAPGTAIPDVGPFTKPPEHVAVFREADTLRSLWAQTQD